MFYLNLFKMNFRSNYEYKKNFYIQVVTMLLNNVFFLGYWIMFFDIFESDIFSLIDIFYVYSVVYVAFGLTQLIAGNLPNIATIIATGQLDIYLIKPRNSLLYMIMSKSSIVALGDIIYGLIALSVTLVKNLRIFVYTTTILVAFSGISRNSHCQLLYHFRIFNVFYRQFQGNHRYRDFGAYYVCNLSTSKIKSNDDISVIDDYSIANY